MPAENANRRPLTRPTEMRRSRAPRARAMTFAPPAGTIAERDAVADAVQRLVDDAVAAEHPDLVAGRVPRELGRMPPALRAQRLLRPQPSLDLGDPLAP